MTSLATCKEERASKSRSACFVFRCKKLFFLFSTAAEPQVSAAAAKPPRHGRGSGRRHGHGGGRSRGCGRSPWQRLWPRPRLRLWPRFFKCSDPRLESEEATYALF